MRRYINSRNRSRLPSATAILLLLSHHTVTASEAEDQQRRWEVRRADTGPVSTAGATSLNVPVYYGNWVPIINNAKSTIQAVASRFVCSYSVALIRVGKTFFLHVRIEAANAAKLAAASSIVNSGGSYRTPFDRADVVGAPQQQQQQQPAAAPPPQEHPPARRPGWRYGRQRPHHKRPPPGQKLRRQDNVRELPLRYIYSFKTCRKSNGT